MIRVDALGARIDELAEQGLQSPTMPISTLRGAVAISSASISMRHGPDFLD
jgi:hypothetical protein